MVERLARRLAKRGRVARRSVEAVGAAVAAYASALVGVQVAELVADERWLVVVVHAAVVIVLLAAITLLSLKLGGAIDARTDWRQTLLRHADLEAEKVVIAAHEYVASERREPLMPMLWVPHDAEAAIRAEVYALYRMLEAAEGPAQPGDRVNFEVTFMTQSPDDGKLTIAAWANRPNRQPVSLTIRNNDPDIYEQSASADMYRQAKERKPGQRLVESTLEAGDDYRALYKGQKSSIRSTIIHPVFNLEADLIGTIVLHCDQEGYFRDADYTFWRELLEPVANRIALERERLDATATLARNGRPSRMASVVRPSPAPRHR